MLMKDVFVELIIETYYHMENKTFQSLFMELAQNPLKSVYLRIGFRILYLMSW